MAIVLDSDLTKRPTAKSLLNKFPGANPLFNAAGLHLTIITINPDHANANKMILTSSADAQIQQPFRHLSKMAACLLPENKTRVNWTVSQLGIQPYQHILEVGFGSGTTLQETARQMQVGFLAGIDASVELYQLAYKRNRKLVQQQFLQLHIGTVGELPYPPHYFHTIYGNNIYPSWREPQYAFMQLERLLKSGGKLVMVFQPKWATTKTALDAATEMIRQQYSEAGLVDTQFAFRDMHPVTCIAATGYKK